MPPTQNDWEAEKQLLQAQLAALQQENEALRRGITAEADESGRSVDEEVLSKVADAVPGLIAYLDHAGYYRFVNAFYESWLGLTREQMIDRHLIEVFGHKTYNQISPYIEQVLTGARVTFELSLTYPLVGEKTVQVTYEPHRLPSGQVIGFYALITDITQRKRAELAEQLLAQAGQLLAESLDYTTRLANVARLAVPLLADWCAVNLLDGATLQHVAVAHVDPAKVKMARDLQQRYPPQPEVLAKGDQPWQQGRSQLMSEIDEAMLEAAARDAEHFQILRDLQFHSAMVVPLTVRAEVLGYILFVWAESGRRYDERDLILAEELARRASIAIDQARLYQEARQLNTELEQRVAERTAELVELQHRQLEGREAERLFLAQELHDGPVQELYGVAYRLSNLQADVAEAGVQRVIQMLRTIASDLRPPSLSEFGLERTIRSHLEQFQAAQPELVVAASLMPDGSILSESVRLALFRIYQEALNNVVRHAGASHVWVRLKVDPVQVVLEIEDDGRGFELPSRWIELARQGHLGLVGMVERVQAVGGWCEFQAVPGQGTMVRAVLPLKVESGNEPESG
jgi:PAS domain S-box-containing protein